MQNLVIDKSIWLRGEGNEKSFLLRSADNKMCCVGIYMKSCGFTTKELKDNGAVEDVEGYITYDTKGDPEKRFKQAKCNWLQNRSTVSDLYETNDNEEISEAEREEQIIEGFAKNGVKVTFVDKLKRTAKKAKAAVKRRRKAKR